MSDVVRFTNGYIALPDGTAAKADLYINTSSGRIISGQSSFFSTHALPARVVDLAGNILSPGFIDVQINGAFGVDFSELPELPEGPGEGVEGAAAVAAGVVRVEQAYLAGLDEVARRITQTGCTSFVPTVITQKEELYSKLLGLLGPRSSPSAAHVLGYHAEGPFLHPHRRGAHSSALLMTAGPSAPSSPTSGPANPARPGPQDETPETHPSPSPPPIAVLERVYGAASLDQPGVKLITLAPDVEGIMECIPNLAARGVTVSIGHSDASLDVGVEALHKGARMLTHLFNAMPPVHHRDPGLIGLLGAPPPTRPYYGLIVDGLHSHPNIVRIAYGAHKDGCVVVTDAQSPLDPALPDGLHQWRDGVQFRKHGDAVYAVYDGVPGETLAGSCCPLNTCVRNLAEWAAVPLPEALLAATLRPALMLGGEVAASKGQLREGWDADLVVLGWDGTVKSTWVMGREVWRCETAGKGRVEKRAWGEVNGKH